MGVGGTSSFTYLQYSILLAKFTIRLFDRDAPGISCITIGKGILSDIVS